MRARNLRPAVWSAAAAWAALAVSSFAQVPPADLQPKPDRWEAAIRAFEAADQANPPPTNAVLFIGSSSIARWTGLAQNFPTHKVINRGFGGSYLADSAAFVDRIAVPYRPKLVLLYAGDNDIAGGIAPERILADFKSFVQKIHAALPETRIGYISIKPCPAREKYLGQVRTTNRLIREYSASDSHLLFIDVFTVMLDKEGGLRPELFVKDGLHLNATGYELWASVIKPILDKYDPPNS